MNNLIIKIVIILFYLAVSKICIGEENKILFKLLNTPFTTYDLEKRKEYLLFVGDNFSLTNEEILDDFISVNIFYQYYIDSNKRLKLDDKINTIYNNVFLERKKNKNFNENLYEKENILINLELDFIRKSILEEFLNTRREEIFINEDEVDLIYNFEIRYINVYKQDLDNDYNIMNTNNFNNIESIEKILIEKNIQYSKAIKEIKNINKLNTDIKNKVDEGTNFFKIEKIDTISFINIKKKFETFDGLMANIYSIETNEQLSHETLKCNKINSLNEYKISNQEYEYLKLNQKIRNNLVEINDFIEFSNNETYTYVILCGIKFNKELLNNINVNKIINITISEIENNFINKYSKQYNLVVLDE